MEEPGTEGEKRYDGQLMKEFFFNESHSINHRTDWFLIFHAVLLQAYLYGPRPELRMVVGYLGLLISFLWLFSGIRTFKLLWQAGNYMHDRTIVGDQLANTFEKIFSERRKHINSKFYGWARPAPLFSVVTPCVFSLAWCFVLALDFSWFHCVLIFATIILLIFIIARLVIWMEERQKQVTE